MISKDIWIDSVWFALNALWHKDTDWPESDTVSIILGTWSWILEKNTTCNHCFEWDIDFLVNLNSFYLCGWILMLGRMARASVIGWRNEVIAFFPWLFNKSSCEIPLGSISPHIILLKKIMPAHHLTNKVWIFKWKKSRTNAPNLK